MPDYLEDLSGLSGVEDWGRWSDSRTVRFTFAEDLPEHFVLHMTGISFGPNAGKDLRVKLGGEVQNFALAPSWTMALHCRGGRGVRTIELTPPDPRSPQELGQSGDVRTLGIGLITMRLEPTP